MRRHASADRQTGVERVLGPLAGPVMRIVWQRDQATVGDVVAALGATLERPPAYTTVMTIMGRLHSRGLLQRTKQGRGYVYRPAADEQRTLDALSGQAVDLLLQKYGTSALRGFAVRLAELDDDLRGELIRLANTRRTAD